MKEIDKMSDHEIKMLGFEAVKKELGVAGFIRFIQQFDRGNGDYTTDRYKWLDQYTFDEIVDEIKKKKY